MVPFFPFAAVGQNSIEFAIGRAVSSIDKRLPFFWKNKPIFCMVLIPYFEIT
jgi:hypothetical protein